MVTSLFVSFNFLVSRYFVFLHFYEHNSISTAFAASSVFHLMKPFEIIAIIVLSSAVLMPSVPFFCSSLVIPFLKVIVLSLLFVYRLSQIEVPD